MPEYTDLEKLLHAVQRSNLHTKQIRTRCDWIIWILVGIGIMIFLSATR